MKCPGHIRPPGTVTVRNAAGPTVHPAELVELPFYDKEKSIPRGLDRYVDGFNDICLSPKSVLSLDGDQ